MSIDEYGKTVILANGSFPTHSIPLNYIKNAKTIICCDGALDKLLNIGIIPTAVVGDGDSVSKDNKEKYKDIFHIDKNYDINDLQKALLFAIKNKLHSIVLLGATGLREDHSLANLSIMIMYAKLYDLDIMMVTNSGVFITAFKTITIKSTPGQPVSIFCFTPKTKLSFENLKYPVIKETFAHLWEGSLNEALSDSFTIRFKKGEIVVFKSFL